MNQGLLTVADEVREALDAGRAVVALESSLIAQGLPVPHNLETALAAEVAVREAGATPATVAVEDGRIVVGADRALLDRLADPERRIAKAGSRDLGPLLAARALASTTVSATMRAAHLAGIAVFSTGGIGGVHRGAAASFDVSSDIDELAATPVAVVCSGAKSILDLAATLELLETRRVPVVGYGTDDLPAFYSTTSGLRVPHRVDGPAAKPPPRSRRIGPFPAPAASSSSSHRPPTWPSNPSRWRPGSRRRWTTPSATGSTVEPSRRTSSGRSRGRRAGERCASTSV